MTDSNATELLCKLLDERGVEWLRDGDGIRWNCVNGGTAGAFANDFGGIRLNANVIPEQAVVATLGADDSSRWFELFGTPERTIRTLAKLGNRYPCDPNIIADCEEECPFGNAPCKLNRDDIESSPLLEWLRGKAVS